MTTAIILDTHVADIETLGRCLTSGSYQHTTHNHSVTQPPPPSPSPHTHTDEEFQRMEAEYDLLKQDNKLKFRDAIPDCTFYQTLYFGSNTCVTYPVSTRTEECQVEGLG